ncbi:hypothetical protein PUNSTDRAFT_46832 [Punctularia strigosozonata HHB-11173 SS5]|uniref:uncharacterized protein n=1 Tax=Punctularia strigosozonata (strain HHB-11173) TaxID=741275 RepID=UPI0004417486|nr:uncharacterized protein PUNSTDRAFT_46832 [Punctularia strigosozonata HHB-11173 SS5]EIN05463.1 hypothetical protein PUNSTDRAFT_46832 [Punctularia strigosozonata HHB-11173 SS5]
MTHPTSIAKAMASLGTGCASMNLMIRAVYIWKQMPHASLAIAALVAICIGHWGLLINSFRIIDSDITDSAPSCTISSTNGHMLGIIYAYTLAYDFVVMVASIAALAKMEGSLTKMEDSLPRTLYRQGVGFFLISCVSNLIPMLPTHYQQVFAFMRLSPIMDVMLTGPSLIVCVIASCRITTHLIASNAQDRRIPTFANANADNVVVDTQETGPTLQFTSHISMPPNPSQFTLQLKSGVAHRDALDRDRNLDRHDLPSPPPPNSPPDHPPPPGLPFTATDPSPPLHMHHTSHDVVAPSPPPAAHLIGRRIFNYDLHRPRDPPPPSHNGWEIQEVARSSGRV